jgi:eukaryotic-like serine/threonine-protein kinase
MRASRKLYSTGLAAMVLLSACSGLHLAQPLKEGASDWTMLAKAETRTSATRESVTPPLSLAWEYDMSGGIGNGCPIVIDSVLLIGNLRGELHGINAYTGKRIGWIDLGEAIQGAPAVDGSVAFVALSNTERSLVAFDLLDGKALWKKPFGDIEATPLIHHKMIYLGNTNGAFYCVNETTGNPMWQFELPDNNRHKGIRSSAAANEHNIVFGAEDGNIYALDSEAGTLKWKYSTGSVIVSTPCIAQDNIYIGNLGGVFIAVELATGTVKWRFNAGTDIYADAAFADSTVFVGTTGGIMYALNSRTGQQIWKTDLGGIINSGAVVANNTLYVGTLKKKLFGLNTFDGAIVYQQEVEGRIKTSPAIAHHRIYVATDNRTVLSFKESPK